jgi:hypothetical protein
MRPLFTIHAGEYLVASRIEKEYKNLNIWLPAKDKGIDLLITDSVNNNAIAIQVKMSRDYRPPKASSDFQKILAATGWIRLSKKALEQSDADIWSVVIVSPKGVSSPMYIHIPPKVLLERLMSIHGDRKEFHFYPWATIDNKCMQGRGMRKKEREAYLEGNYELGARDFTEYLENWTFLESLCLPGSMK